MRHRMRLLVWLMVWGLAVIPTYGQTRTDVTQLGGVAVSLGSGVIDTGTQRVTIPTDDPINDNTASAADSLSTLVSNLGVDGSQGASVPTGGPVIMGEAKDFDGSALPNVVTEGQAVRVATTLSGIPFGFLTNEAGTKELGKLEDDAHASADYGVPIWTRRIDTTAASSGGASGDYATLDTDQLGRLWTRDANPCMDFARVTTAAISESTAATNEIVGLTASNLIYVCSYKFVTTAANSLNWAYGTGTDCATGLTAIEGAQPYAANGGVTESGGGAAIIVVPSGNALCLTSTAATAHGGRVTYVKTAAP